MRFVGIREVCSKTSLGRTAIWALEKRGEFPPRRKILSNRVAWLEEEVETWMREQALADAGRADGAEISDDRGVG